MNVVYGSDSGKTRNKNKDSIIAIKAGFIYESIKHERMLMVIGCGIDDAPSGEIASYLATKMLAEYLLPELSSSVDKINYLTSLNAGIKTVNRKLLEYTVRNPKHAKMSSTILAAIIDDKRLYVVNVGDSNLFIINKDEIKQVTEDHADTQGAPINAVGIFPNVEPDLFSLTLEERDFILLCCNGLNSMVNNSDMRAAVLEGTNLNESYNRLIRLANTKGRVDNISVILAEYTKGLVEGKENGCAGDC